MDLAVSTSRAVRGFLFLHPSLSDRALCSSRLRSQQMVGIKGSRRWRVKPNAQFAQASFQLSYADWV